MSELEVLGGGFGRTGTMSLCVALRQLGYKTHHMHEVFGNREQVASWHQATRDRAAGRPIDWSRPLRGYNAAVDWPAVSFVKELLAANPRVKVVLTTRDFDSWYESALNTLFRVKELTNTIRPPRYLAPIFRGLTDMSAFTEELIWGGTFGGRFADKEATRKVYEAHLAEVRALVPPGQLLEFRVAEGWGPLCAFLGKPVPEGPFPRLNDTAEFIRIAGQIRVLARTLRVLFAASNTAIAAAAVAAVAIAIKRLRDWR